MDYGGIDLLPISKTEKLHTLLRFLETKELVFFLYFGKKTCIGYCYNAVSNYKSFSYVTSLPRHSIQVLFTQTSS